VLESGGVQSAPIPASSPNCNLLQALGSGAVSWADNPSDVLHTVRLSLQPTFQPL